MFDAKVLCPSFGTDYVQVVADKIAAFATQNPLMASEVVVFVPTQRIRNRLCALLSTGKEGATVLPRIYTLGAISADDVLELTGVTLPQKRVMSAREVQIRLAHIIRDHHVGAVKLTFSQAIHLAQDLGNLLATLAYHDCHLDDLDRVVTEDFAAHWQITASFLQHVYQAWEAYCQEHKVIAAAQHHVHAVQTLIHKWQEHPLPNPVIVMGSTGSLPITMNLIEAIASLPNGHVIAPLGTDLLGDRPDELAQTHPLSPGQRLITKLSAHPQQVLQQGNTLEVRASHILQGLEGKKSNATLDAQVTTLVAEDQDEEAQMIACLLREVVEHPTQTGLLITHNRQLVRRVEALLKKWEIAIEDSAGQPLSTTREGSAVLEVLHALTSELDPFWVSLQLFKEYGEGKEQSLYAKQELSLRNSRLPDSPQWSPEIIQCAEKIKELRGRFAVDTHHVADFIDAHHALVQAVCEVGESVERAWRLLRECASDYGYLTLAEYSSLIESFLHSETARTYRESPHPRLQILGPLEARGMQADVVILGSLVQGDWPRKIPADPWMSRAMREDVGLSPLEQRISLSAHDFVAAFANPTVYLTRSKHINGQEQIPTSWWVKLARDFEGCEQTQDWRMIAQTVFQPEVTEVSVSRPQPTPPVELRPQRFSATDIGALMVDPYTTFAKKILNLRPLDNLNEEPDAAMRGTVLHRALELAMGNFVGTRQVPTLEALHIWVQQAAVEEKISPRLLRQWLPRFDVIFTFFIDHLRANQPQASFAEVWGELTLPNGHTVFAKADRIDVDHEGGLHIIDYKTGGIPTRKDVEQGFAPQLLVEGIIAKHNGFECVPPGPVRSLQYWSLTGGINNGQITMFDKDVAGLLLQAEEGISEVLEHYQTHEVGYPAYPHEAHVPRYNDYEELSRYQEWK